MKVREVTMVVISGRRERVVNGKGTHKGLLLAGSVLGVQVQ